MNHQLDKEVKKIILDNLESAELVYKNLAAAKTGIMNTVRRAVKERLQGDPSLANFEVRDHFKAEDKNSGLWLFHKSVRSDLGIHFGIEPFSGYGHKRDELFIGIIDLQDRYNKVFAERGLTILGWWREVEFLHFNGVRLCLSKSKILQDINRNPEILNNLIQQIAGQVVEYVLRWEHLYLEICAEASSPVE